MRRLRLKSTFGWWQDAIFTVLWLLFVSVPSFRCEGDPGPRTPQAWVGGRGCSTLHRSLSFPKLGSGWGKEQDDKPQLQAEHSSLPDGCRLQGTLAGRRGQSENFSLALSGQPAPRPKVTCCCSHSLWEHTGGGGASGAETGHLASSPATPAAPSRSGR